MREKCDFDICSLYSPDNELHCQDGYEDDRVETCPSRNGIINKQIESLRAELDRVKGENKIASDHLKMIRDTTVTSIEHAYKFKEVAIQGLEALSNPKDDGKEKRCK